MGYDIGITTTPTDNWFCEGGNCYQHPNGTLTYAQCKASCVLEDRYSCEQGYHCYPDPNGVYSSLYNCQASGCMPRVTIPCTVIAEGCEDYQTYLNNPSAYPLTLQQLLDSWVINLALPQMGGHVVTAQQVLDLLQRCCVGIGVRGGGRSKGINLTNPTGTPTNDIRIKNK